MIKDHYFIEQYHRVPLLFDFLSPPCYRSLHPVLHTEAIRTCIERHLFPPEHCGDSPRDQSAISFFSVGSMPSDPFSSFVSGYQRHASVPSLTKRSINTATAGGSGIGAAMSSNSIKLLTGNSHPELAKKVADR